MRRALVLAVSAIVVAAATPASAAPGDLDSTFSGDGQTAVTFAEGNASPTDVAIQSDGKIVAVGYVVMNGTNDAWALTRFKRNGTLDTTFGGDGRVVTNWSGADDEASGVVILGNGKIVAAGYASGTFAAARYLPSGALDHTFGGGDGRVTLDFTPSHDRAWDVAMAPGGKLVLAGQAGPGSHPVIALARLKANGTPDPGFSGDGKATEDIGPSYGWDVVVESDSSIVVTGNADGGSHDAAVLTKFTPQGEVDEAFGDAGYWIGVSDTASYANGVIRLPSGKYLVAAAVGAGASDYDVGLFRFNANGHGDDTYGTHGLVTSDFESKELVTDIDRSGNGLLVSFTRFRTGEGGQMALARFHLDGSPDTDFGDLGLAVATLPSANAHALALQDDGRIVVVGASTTGPTTRLGAARFLSS